MSATKLAQFTLLPELEFVGQVWLGPKTLLIRAKKSSEFEVCPKCATKCRGVYDHRTVRFLDAPIRDRGVVVEVRKRRFRCQSCTATFMEPIPGVQKGAKFSERFKRHLLWCCEKFSDLKQVVAHLRCSYGFLYKALYEQLELKRRMHKDPWPRVIGIDEHSFRRNKGFGFTEFATLIVDHRNRKVIEVAHGKSKVDLKQQTAHLENRENVHWVTMDLCQPFRSYVRDMFPNARIVADKFHVVRLLDHHVNAYRKAITGDKRRNPIRKLLLKNDKDLDHWQRSAIYKWLAFHPDLREIYFCKQALHRFYRIRGYRRAKEALKKLLDRMGKSRLSEIQTLRKTLIKWSHEVLNYFRTGLTNARVEGFNNKAKLIKRRGYGYRSFSNYRLRVLNACC